MLSKNEKINLVSEMNKILTQGVTLKNFRRLSEIRSLLKTDGILDNLQTMFDIKTSKYIHLVKLSDGTYEEYLNYLHRN